MELSLFDQVREFVWAILLGASLGLVYDIMRIIRGRIPKPVLTMLLDGIYWIVCATAAFGFAMGFGGGELKLYSLLAMCGGIIAYFLLLSIYVRSIGFMVLDAILNVLQTLWKPIQPLRKKISNILIKCFPFVQKYTIIKNNRKKRRDGEYEATKNQLAGKAGNPNIHRVLSNNPDQPASANQPTQSRHRRNTDAKRDAGAHQRPVAGGYRL